MHRLVFWHLNKMKKWLLSKIPRHFQAYLQISPLEAATTTLFMVFYELNLAVLTLLQQIPCRVVTRLPPGTLWVSKARWRQVL